MCHCPAVVQSAPGPVDIHINGLIKMGADITVEGGFIHAKVDRLKGCRLVLEQITVTGTENLLMAATLAEGNYHYGKRR